MTFDTNVYRFLGPGAFAALRDLEANHGVVGFACYPVVTELLAHLASQSDPDARASRAALERLASHCTEYNGSQYIVRFLAGAIEQMCFTLFNSQPDDGGDDPSIYGQLIGEIVNDPEAVVRLAGPLTTIAKGTEEARAKYTQQLWHNVVQTIVPGAQHWRDLGRPHENKARILKAIDAGKDLDLIARALVAQAGARIERPLAEDELPALAGKILAYYPVIVHYRSLITRRLIDHGPDMAKRCRANGALDLHVCTATSPIASVAGLPQLLVTDDADILEAGRRAGVRYRLLTPSEYEALLNKNRGELQTELDSWPKQI